MNQHCSSGLPWTWRAIQLDLARHLETTAYIRDYAREARDLGFNQLVLYLEARVRTPSFAFRPRGDTYSLREMAGIVAHGARLGLDVIPVVSTLGHCEQFLACRELAHLSETRGGRGRFGPARGHGNVVCPSLAESRRFFETYLSELCQVFTGPHFHAGLDEVWDLGYCPTCRARWRREGLGALFARHVRWTRGVLRNLGKRMWIWDDFFEFFPERLDDIPRDVVMCHWCYDEEIRPEGAAAHFANRWRQDWLRLYARKGFDAMVCPCDRVPRNIEAFTAYAKNAPVKGGLLTEWGSSPRLHAAHGLSAALAGRLWRSAAFDPDRAWNAATRRCVPGADRGVREAVRLLASLDPPAGQRFNKAFLDGPLTHDEWLQRNAVRLAGERIAQAGVGQLPRHAQRTLQRLRWNAEMDDWQWALREVRFAALDPRTSATDRAQCAKRLAALERQYRELDRRYRRLWRQPARHARPQDRIGTRWHGLAAVLQDLRERLRADRKAGDGWLLLRLFLQDFYALACMSVEVQEDGRWRRALERAVLKPPSHSIRGHMGGHYTLYVPFRLKGAPRGVRLEVTGYGGQGHSCPKQVTGMAQLMG